MDGSFGDATLYALNLFQGDAGYKERNYANSDVLEKLYSKKAPSYDAFATLKKGKKGIRVFLLQSYLKNAGYDPGTIDSSYGANTETAVKNFQAAQNIPATGHCGYDHADSAVWSVRPCVSYSRNAHGDAACDYHAALHRTADDSHDYGSERIT